MKKWDFYDAAAPLAFVVGLGWVFLAMVVFKIPAWPAMVGMAGYYAVGGLACHERHGNTGQSVKGLLWGSAVSWIGVALWATWFRGNPVAMGIVMGVVAAVFVLSTKWHFMGRRHLEAMPQAFLGATIYFGLFTTYMMARGVPDGALFGWLAPLTVPGSAQPHVAGVLAVLSGLAGVLLGIVHQNLAFMLSREKPRAEDMAAR